MTSARVEARQDAFAAQSTLCDKLREMATNDALPLEVRTGALEELAEVENRWDNLADHAHKRATYAGAADDFEDRLMQLEMSEAYAMGTANCGPANVSGTIDLNTLQPIHTGCGALLEGPLGDWLPGGGSRGVSFTDGQSMAELQRRDPEAFAEWFKGLGDDERQLAMQNLQTYTQDRMQLTTMLTNMLQASHEATMAVARNLSV